MHVLRGSPYQVLIKTILSHRTKDEITDAVSEVLFDRYPDTASLKAADAAEVEEIIHPTGFFSVKAKRIIVDEKYGGHVPSTREKLLELPGVGPKTANCVLLYAYGEDAIPVDTHVHRIANRLGWVSETAPEKTEASLTKVVPKELWADINELLVTFGKTICRPVSPKCSECKLRMSCRYSSDSHK